MKDGLDFLRDEKFWYKPHGTGRPMRHKVAAQAYDEIDRLTKMTAAMESVMSKIGDHFNVKPGDVDGLFAAIEAQSAEVTELRNYKSALPPLEYWARLTEQRDHLKDEIRHLYREQGMRESEIEGFMEGWADIAVPVSGSPEPNPTKCPECGGPADSGHDRCMPPNPYLCTKCEQNHAENPGKNHGKTLVDGRESS